jgi:short chain dehydrogenase
MRHAVQSLALHGVMPQRRGPKRREDRMSEQQRVAIVTGAAGGIGRELVLGLLGKGIKVAAVDRTT